MRAADLRIDRRDGIVIAHVIGEIDLSNATELRVAVTDATPNDALGVVLDLSEVSYIDSAGIHLLFRLGENLRSRGQTLRIVIPPGSPPNDALRLAGIKRHVEVVEELEEGVQAVTIAGGADT